MIKRHLICMAITGFAPVLGIKIRHQRGLVHVAFVTVAYFIKYIKGACCFSVCNNVISWLAIKLYRAFFYLDISFSSGKKTVFHPVTQLFAGFKSYFVYSGKFLGKKGLEAAACQNQHKVFLHWLPVKKKGGSLIFSFIDRHG